MTVFENHSNSIILQHCDEYFCNIWVIFGVNIQIRYILAKQVCETFFCDFFPRTKKASSLLKFLDFQTFKPLLALKYFKLFLCVHFEEKIFHIFLTVFVLVNKVMNESDNK